MNELLTSKDITFASDCDGVIKKSSPRLTDIAKTIESTAKKSSIGIVIFDQAAYKIYRLQPIIPNAVSGVNDIFTLLNDSERNVWYEILSNRPVAHTQYTRDELALIGINPHEVACVGTDLDAKSERILGELQKGSDVVLLEDDVRQAKKVLSNNTQVDQARAIAYLFNDHSGEKSYPGLIRVSSFEHVIYDLKNRLTPLN